MGTIYLYSLLLSCQIFHSWQLIIKNTVKLQVVAYVTSKFQHFFFCCWEKYTNGGNNWDQAYRLPLHMGLIMTARGRPPAKDGMETSLFA